MTTLKKTAFGTIGIAAAGLLTLGFAAPAMAADSTDSHDSSYTSTSTDSVRESSTRLLDHASINDLLNGGDSTITGGDTSTWAPVVLAPSVSTGDLASGNELGNGNTVASGNPIASGNDTTAPIASGNTTPIASGNDTSVDGNAVASPSGNETAVGNATGNAVGNLTGNTLGSVGDLTSGIGTDVSDIVDGSLGSLGAGVGH